MNKDNLKRIILDNQDRIEKQQLIKRDLLIDYQSLKKLHKIAAITGPRRAGKTFYLFQIIDNLKLTKEDVVFLDFSEIILSDFKPAHFELLLIAFIELFPHKTPVFFLDEIQEVLDFEQGLKYLLNRDFLIFITGSSSALQSGDIASTLRGKTLNFSLLPLSFNEFLRFRSFEPPPNPTTHELGRINSYLLEYLLWGGFPEVVLTDNERTKLNLLSSYIDSMLLRDILEKHSIRNSHIIEHFFIKLAQSFTKQFSINKVFHELKGSGIKVSKDTLHLYLRYFEDTLFFFTLTNYLAGATSPKKVYACDNGIYRYVKRLEQDYGKMLENRVFLDLKKTNRKLYFAQTQSWEVDFLAEEEVIQTCFSLSQENLDRERKGLLEIAKQVGPKNRNIIFFESSVSLRMDDISSFPYCNWALEMS
jgi:predicted AAA+ superfamily ATPase